MSRRKARVAVAVTAVIVPLAVTTAAYGYFTAVGSGHGSGSSSTGQSLSISPGTPSDALYPGGAASVVLTIANPSGASVHVSSLQLDTSQANTGFAVDAAHSLCSTGALSFTIQSGGWDVPAHGSLPISLPDAIAMSTAAANACQGATFTVYLEAS